MQVRKIMTKNPACCTPDSTLQEVAHMMEMYDCGCIPVVDNHQDKRPVGTVTDRDITVRTFSAGKNPLEMKASDVMTTDIVTVTPDTNLQDCLNVMENRQIRRVLVVDKNGKCAGIVAQADLAEHEADSSRTANFVREVSESESDRSQERGFESNRRQDGGRDDRQNNRSYSQNQTSYKSRVKYGKPNVKKESFFNTTTLLTLLGSIGLGAGLKYYLGLEGARKIDTGNLRAKAPVAKKTNDSSIQTTIETTKPSVASTTEKTQTRETISGTVNSFNKTDTDDDLKPITEIGRTATNT